MIDWVDIPAGPFEFGVEIAIDGEASPRRVVELPRFRISRNVITAGLWSEYSDAIGESPRVQTVHRDAPISDVTWFECVDFCKWLSGRLGIPGISLPTEQQWERACRGTDGRRFPWGDDELAFSMRIMYQRYGPKGASALRPKKLPLVGAPPQFATPSGVQDMCTHVQEWCANGWKVARWTDPSIYDDFSDLYKVVRGGHWAEFHYETYRRTAVAPTDHYGLLGFRVARES